MVFCGQCGFQLAPGTARCSRCGAFTDVDTSAATVDALHADDPTSMSMRATQNPSRTTQRTGGSKAEQSPLVLRGNTNVPSNPNTQGTYGATVRGTSPSYETYAPPQVSSPNQQGSFPGYQPQTNTSYPPQSGSYADFHTPDQMGYPPASYQQWQPAATPVRSPKGRNTGLLLILFGVLLILGALVLFALRHQLISSTTGASTGTSSTTTITATVATSAEQAVAVIKQHYTDINNHDYQAAYQLWRHNPNTLAGFQQGYAHTRYVAWTVNDIIAQSDGTEKVIVTLNATEDNPSGQGVHHSIYKGYYIVGSVNGTWLIFSGQLH